MVYSSANVLTVALLALLLVILTLKFFLADRKRTPTMSTPELTHIFKIERARKHLEDLNIALNEWVNGHLHPTRLDPDPDDPTHLFVKSGIDPIPVDPFSLMLGDCVQNLRSSLDHLVFALTKVYTCPLTEETARKTQFPIIGDESSKGVSGFGSDRFRDNAVQMLQAINPKAKTVIERLQPYQRGRNFRSHPLWQLNELSNIDKHRMLHVTAWNFTALGIPRDMLLPREEWREGGELKVFSLGAVEGEAIFARIPRGILVPDPEMHMNIFPAFEIAFKDGPLIGEKVIPILSDIFNYIVTEVTPALDSFF
ncbi:MAG: hypothetical protein KOO63_05335 [Bacteroidales bacterium]|nr:hypothetical protein [Candidatus Latescibacterota bacterium]